MSSSCSNRSSCDEVLYGEYRKVSLALMPSAGKIPGPGYAKALRVKYLAFRALLTFSPKDQPESDHLLCIPKSTTWCLGIKPCKAVGVYVEFVASVN